MTNVCLSSGYICGQKSQRRVRFILSLPQCGQISAWPRDFLWVSECFPGGFRLVDVYIISQLLPPFWVFTNCMTCHFSFPLQPIIINIYAAFYSSVHYGSWFDHVKGWTSHSKDFQNFLYVTYEDMWQVRSFIWWPHIGLQILKEAVSLCNISILSGPSWGSSESESFPAVPFDWRWADPCSEAL